MRERGYRYTCDRCKTQQFDIDDGSAIVSPPEGWAFATYPHGFMKSDGAWLCPKCSEECTEAIINFMNAYKDTVRR